MNVNTAYDQNRVFATELFHPYIGDSSLSEKVVVNQSVQKYRHCSRFVADYSFPGVSHLPMFSTRMSI